MSFIANQPVKTSTDPASNIVENDGWFPDIDLETMRDNMRLDGTVTTPRLIDATVAAIIYANRELSDWKKLQITAGYASLAEVPADKVNRESMLVSHYIRAVYCTAKADLIERYKDYDTTSTTLNEKKTTNYLDSAPDEQRRNAQWAIADILGVTHMTVELI